MASGGKPRPHDETSAATVKLPYLTVDAKDATDREHSMTVREAIKLYPKAVAWSVFLSSAVAMEGYDIILIAAFFAFPPWNEKFGTRIPGSDKYQVSVAWQSGLSNGARVGQIFGLILNGFVADRFGYRKTMVAFLLLMIGFIFVPFFAKDIAMLQAGVVLMGVPWGVFQTLTTTYAAEVCPVVLRGYLTTYVNMMWGLGQLVATGALRGFLNRSDQWAYRIPYALQWAWPVPLLIGALFAPESPWWLVRKSRLDDAKRSLKRLTSDAPEGDIEQTLAMMVHTDELEKDVSVGSSYLDCFRGVDLRRTEITCFAWAIQPLCGASLQGFSAYFFKNAGLPTDISFDFSMALYAVAMVGVVIAWFAMSRFGRRTLFLAGLSAMFLILLTIGFVSLAPSQAKGPNFAIGSLLLLWTLCYDITVGTLTYAIVTEMPSGRLRTKTVVLGRSLYNIIGIVNGIITPRMLNPSAWDWKGKVGFFWAGMCFLCLSWAYFRLPEAKGRSFGEIDALFERGVSARKFKSTAVDLFEQETFDRIEKSK